MLGHIFENFLKLLGVWILSNYQKPIFILRDYPCNFTIGLHLQQLIIMLGNHMFFMDGKVSRVHYLFEAYVTAFLVHTNNYESFVVTLANWLAGMLVFRIFLIYSRKHSELGINEFSSQLNVSVYITFFPDLKHFRFWHLCWHKIYLDTSMMFSNSSFAFKSALRKRKSLCSCACGLLMLWEMPVFRISENKFFDINLTSIHHFLLHSNRNILNLKKKEEKKCWQSF